MQTTKKLLEKVNVRRENKVGRRVVLEERERYEVDRQAKIYRSRRCKSLFFLGYQYMQAYDDLKDDLVYVEPIDIEVIIPT